LVEALGTSPGVNYAKKAIVGSYVENESGAKLARTELFRLIADSRPGDVLLVEQVDRLSRLTDSDWRKLRSELDAKQIRVVALDLPTSWQMASTGDEFTRRMFAAINGMMLDMLAAVARKDYEDRRRRQAQGIVKAKAAGASAAGRKMSTATLASPVCFVPACHGRPFKRRQAAQPRDYRQGRQAGRVGASKRFDRGIYTTGRRKPLTCFLGRPSGPS
jgi:DNA invertase Pin-like site-specific DNA recombinase